MNIAIDGPAGAGKSTIAKLVAKKLGFIYVDTGAMYRAIALYFTTNDVDITDMSQVDRALSAIKIEIRYQDDSQQVILNDENVTGRLRDEAVGNMASKSSAIPLVREKLLSLQRDLAAANDVVMDGRDIGTNILPDAELKIYLTASSAVRAKRRYDELMASGKTADLSQIEADIITRDKQDMSRAIAPLKQAEDAVYLDSSDMDIDTVAETIIRYASERM